MIHLANKNNFSILCSYITHIHPSQVGCGCCCAAWSSRDLRPQQDKGYQKRGGSKLTKEHRKHGTVAHTNENRTSRICSCCFMPVFLSRGQRVRDGESKTVRLNGSVDCKNPTCPRRREGHGTMGRDANAANNIAILGGVHSALIKPLRPPALSSLLSLHQQHQHHAGRFSPQVHPLGCDKGLSFS